MDLAHSLLGPFPWLHSGRTPDVPNIGFDSFYLADDYNLADNTTITSGWREHFGGTTLTLVGTPKYRVNQSAVWNRQPYIEWTAATDLFYAALGNIAQPFVLVTGDRVTNAPAASRLMIDAYTDGTLPANRVLWQYQDTIIDQSRLLAPTALSTGWSAGIGFNTETLWEGIANGVSSEQKANGTQIASGDAGAGSMDGLSLGQYTGTGGGCETRQLAYVGRISKANWDAGRAQFVAWHNDKYAEAAT